MYSKENQQSIRAKGPPSGCADNFQTGSSLQFFETIYYNNFCYKIYLHNLPKRISLHKLNKVI